MPVVFEHEGQGRVAAAAANHVGGVIKVIHDGVVGADTDFAVMGEHEIAEAAEGLRGTFVITADRGAGGVAAGHDEDVGHGGLYVVGVVKEQHLHGRVGQHDANFGVGGGYEVGDGAGLFAPEQDDGFLVAGEDGLLAGAQLAFAAHDGHIACHDSKGLDWAVLELAQAGDGFFVFGVAGEVKAADALDGDDAAAGEGAAGAGDGVLTTTGFIADDVELGAAVVAADRLGVVAAAVGIRVFCGAVGAHGEFLHAGAFTVVGHGVEDGEARAAGGAVDKRMEVAAVRRVEEFFAAFVAGGDVGGDEDVAALAGAFNDGKVCVGLGGVEGLGVDLEDGGAGRGLLGEGGVEGGAVGCFALGEDFDVGAFVGDAALDVVAGGEAVDKGAEANALDDAVDFAVIEGHAEKLTFLLD